MSADPSVLLLELERELGVARPEELPRLIGELARLQAQASARLTSEAANGRRPVAETRDELLDVKEAARRLGLKPRKGGKASTEPSTDFLYRAKELPFRVRIGRRVRFSARGIERYIQQRQGR